MFVVAAVKTKITIALFNVGARLRQSFFSPMYTTNVTTENYALVMHNQSFKVCFKCATNLKSTHVNPITNVLNIWNVSWYTQKILKLMFEMHCVICIKFHVAPFYLLHIHVSICESHSSFKIHHYLCFMYKKFWFTKFFLNSSARNFPSSSLYSNWHLDPGSFGTSHPQRLVCYLARQSQVCSLCQQAVDSWLSHLCQGHSSFHRYWSW